MGKNTIQFGVTSLCQEQLSDEKYISLASEKCLMNYQPIYLIRKCSSRISPYKIHLQQKNLF
jgi:hypothetical protein